MMRIHPLPLLLNSLIPLIVYTPIVVYCNRNIWEYLTLGGGSDITGGDSPVMIGSIVLATSTIMVAVTTLSTVATICYGYQ